MIAEILADFESVVTLRRRNADAVVKGRATHANPTTTTITAVVVPTVPDDLVRLPEGSRARKTKRVFTRSQLRMEPYPDEIVYAGETYEVAHVQSWEEHGDFCDAIAVKALT